MPKRRRSEAPSGFEREPGDGPPAAGGSPASLLKTLREPASDSIEELYRLARLISEDIVSRVSDPEERACGLDARGLRDALARARDVNVGRVAESLEKAYTMLLRRAEKVPFHGDTRAVAGS